MPYHGLSAQWCRAHSRGTAADASAMPAHAPSRPHTQGAAHLARKHAAHGLLQAAVDVPGVVQQLPKPPPGLGREQQVVALCGGGPGRGGRGDARGPSGAYCTGWRRLQAWQLRAREPLALPQRMDNVVESCCQGELEPCRCRQAALVGCSADGTLLTGLTRGTACSRGGGLPENPLRGTPRPAGDSTRRAGLRRREWRLSGGWGAAAHPRGRPCGAAPQRCLLGAGRPRRGQSWAPSRGLRGGRAHLMAGRQQGGRGRAGKASCCVAARPVHAEASAELHGRQQAARWTPRTRQPARTFSLDAGQAVVVCAGIKRPLCRRQGVRQRAGNAGQRGVGATS